MTHVPGHIPPNQHCPKCIIDDGRLAAAARFFARRNADEEMADEALHLADVADAVRHATECAFEHETVTEAQADELHAMSELSCHRAAALRAWARGEAAFVGTRSKLYAKATLIAEWADELANHSTQILGGEYHGAWIVDGITGIRKRE